MKFSDREEIISLTAEWKGERFPDGRPRVPDICLDALRKIIDKISSKIPEIKGRPEPMTPPAGFLASGRRYGIKKGGK